MKTSKLSELQTVLSGPPDQVAPRLLGCYLVRQIDGQKLIGKIVETEAYDQADAASHSYKGQTPRTDIMFGPSGHLYVYFTYGMHYCCNVVTGDEGRGSAVLIRALEPVAGEALMAANRHSRVGSGSHQLANGPAKLCQALQVDKQLNGHDLSREPLQLVVSPPLPQTALVQTTRIGISRAQDVPWRFYIKGSPYVSVR